MITEPRPSQLVSITTSARRPATRSGPRLLLAIKARSSLTLAARDVGWSYRHAWEYVRRAERVLGVAVTGSVPGKGTKRGTALTPYGVSILNTLAALRERVDGAVGITERVAVHRLVPGDSHEVLEGVKPGELVVTAGSFFLRAEAGRTRSGG